MSELWSPSSFRLAGATLTLDLPASNNAADLTLLSPMDDDLLSSSDSGSLFQSPAPNNVIGNNSIM